jgi:hypothetical protein
VSPFSNILRVIPNVQLQTVKQFSKSILASHPRRDTEDPAAAACRASGLVQGYITQDDVSAQDPGDDTIHCSIPFFDMSKKMVLSPPEVTSDEPFWDIVYVDYVDKVFTDVYNQIEGKDGKKYTNCMAGKNKKADGSVLEGCTADYDGSTSLDIW